MKAMSLRYRLMHNHFDKHLNVKELILERQPKVLVECGGASGENTRQILSLLEIYSFKLYTISDAPYAEETMKLDNRYSPKEFEWIYDLSYKAMRYFRDHEIDFCSIDTDHNYWTMREELRALHPKLKPGGLIVMHDTETYRKNSGQAYRYGTSDPYPGEEISKYEKMGLGMGDAVCDFLDKHSEYKVIRESLESHGAMAIEKGVEC